MLTKVDEMKGENAVVMSRNMWMYLDEYEQDGICDTWQVLADMVYPRGLRGLKKKAGTAYAEIGRAKCEWADKIGCLLDLDNNNSPSFCRFIQELRLRIEAA